MKACRGFQATVHTIKQLGTLAAVCPQNVLLEIVQQICRTENDLQLLVSLNQKYCTIHLVNVQLWINLDKIGYTWIHLDRSG